MRAFLALSLPDRVVGELVRVQQRLRSVIDAVRWTAQSNLHLTLRFLGAAPLSQIDAIGQLLDQAVRSRAPFTFRLGAPGAFPNSRHARVLWVGVENIAAVAELVSELDHGLAQMGWPPPDQPWQAHVTLGRLRTPRPCPQLDSLRDWCATTGQEEFVFETADLMESRLTPSGRVYRCLISVPASGAQA